MKIHSSQKWNITECLNCDCQVFASHISHSNEVIDNIILLGKDCLFSEKEIASAKLKLDYSKNLKIRLFEIKDDKQQKKTLDHNNSFHEDLDANSPQEISTLFPSNNKKNFINKKYTNEVTTKIYTEIDDICEKVLFYKLQEVDLKVNQFKEELKLNFFNEKNVLLQDKELLWERIKKKLDLKEISEEEFRANETNEVTEIQPNIPQLHSISDAEVTGALPIPTSSNEQHTSISASAPVLVRTLRPASKQPPISSLNSFSLTSHPLFLPVFEDEEISKNSTEDSFNKKVHFGDNKQHLSQNTEDDTDIIFNLDGYELTSNEKYYKILEEETPESPKLLKDNSEMENFNDIETYKIPTLVPSSLPVQIPGRFAIENLDKDEDEEDDDDDKQNNVDFKQKVFTSKVVNFGSKPN
ncbi:hypothetical protein HK099_007266 [Clydaea vesicula]|uniref:Uncharacterized protein n=1 Tax=Clydaea vesicula TaxID=447962 RepID=A0AAD5XYK6_9FUNG|nr:hypothetical protein HK099_007266 [Clydaea vesicula]